MIRLKSLIRLVLLCFPLFVFNNSIKSQVKKPVQKTEGGPKLVIGLVIDQMRYDYLYRYAAGYGNGGFKRLLREGFNCQNTFLNYMPTVTGCGHASLYTGSIPALHGIVSNDWYDRQGHRMMYCTQDDSAKSVGTTTKAGKMSPKNLLATTLGDEIRLATNFRGKVIGISLKDRGAILPAGGSANAAYWMEDTLGHFVTSDWYMKELPYWVQSFNNAEKAKKYLLQDWNTKDPLESYLQSTADNTIYEGKFKDEAQPTFPHLTSKFSKWADIKRTPYGNTIMLDFAIEAIEQEQLGRDKDVDLLALSLSSPDIIGHMYGIDAIELEDCYRRLDRDIEKFLNVLDAKVGKGNYTLFLSADHGAAHNPIFLQDHKIPGGYYWPAQEKKRINELAKAKWGKSVVADIGDNQIWLNDSVEYKEALNFVLDEINKSEGILFAGAFSNINQAILPEVLKQIFINGYMAKRSGDIYYVLDPAWQEGYGNGAKTGTTHGAWNPHDARIPLVLFGKGIKKGSTTRKINAQDIAITLANLLNIQMPNTCIGISIGEALE